MNVKIGTQNTDKSKYIESLVFLNRCINSLCDLAQKKSKNKIIKVIDREPTKKDIIKQRNSKLKEIYFESMVNRSKNKGINL